LGLLNSDFDDEDGSGDDEMAGSASEEKGSKMKGIVKVEGIVEVEVIAKVEGMVEV
jgi:hypothetical protein